MDDRPRLQRRESTNGSVTIPAGAKDVAVPGEIAVREPVWIWGLMPHTHLRGARWQYKLEKPEWHF